ncbi:MAG: hypothetical protein QOF71_1144 [Candidatus Eremiobacteraeota bacterium]|jgi:hypothetical protein|nr:hypothetical protein [Candidatus Eremiobacteraeota bacterium]
MSQGRSFLPLIRAAFDPVLLGHGFSVERQLSQDDLGSGGDIVWYRAGARTVCVSYAAAAEQWCDVSLGGYGEPEAVRDLATFVHGLQDGTGRHYSTRDPAAFEREARRCAEELVTACGEFLTGDIAAFRERYAELLHVESIRSRGLTSWYARDIEGTARWYTLIEEYLRRDESARLVAARVELRRAAYRAKRAAAERAATRETGGS